MNSEDVVSPEDSRSTTFREQVRKVKKVWRKHGHKKVPSVPGMPLHPELVYRKSGEWQGWSHFLGQAPSEKNKKRDEIEDAAWLEYST